MRSYDVIDQGLPLKATAFRMPSPAVGDFFAGITRALEQVPGPHRFPGVVMTAEDEDYFYLTVMLDLSGVYR